MLIQNISFTLLLMIVTSFGIILTNNAYAEVPQLKFYEIKPATNILQYPLGPHR